MSDYTSSQGRLVVARYQYKRMRRVVVLLGVLTAVSLASQFISLFGAPVGIFPWFMTIATGVVFGFTVMLLQSAKADVDEAEADVKTGPDLTADMQDAKEG